MLQRNLDIVHVLVVVAVCYLTVQVYQLATDPLRDIPGPRLARFTKLWLATQYASGDFHETNIELHRKYGPIVRISPNEYSINDPSSLKTLYGHGSALEKGTWYTPWGNPWFPNLFNITSNKQHGAMRRKISKPYSMTSLLGYEPYVDECTRIFKERLREFAASGEGVDMGRWFQLYAFDMIGQITWSSRLGFLDKGEDIMGCISILDFGNYYNSVMGMFTNINRVIMKAATRFGGQLGLEEFVGDRIKKTQAVEKSSSKQASNEGPVDFITKLVREQNENPSKITTTDIHVSASQNVFAGTDTTSISLSGILYHLLRTPEALSKLRQELRTARESGMISKPITFQQARSLPYLDAVIREGLRVHPATGFTMPRVMPKGGATIAGRFFPEKTTVGVNSWVCHRNQEVFGTDADDFRPERWIGISKEEASRFEANNLTFGQGARTCIGKNISLLETYKVIPEIVQDFDFALVEQGNWKLFNSWFVKPVDFRCVVKSRES